MIWFSIITLVISCIICAYYYDKSETKPNDVSSEEVIFGFFIAGVISIISLLFIFYTVLNLFFDGIKKMGIFGLLLLFLVLIFVIFKLSSNLKKSQQDKLIK
jgi:hypothetical protein